MRDRTPSGAGAAQGAGAAGRSDRETDGPQRGTAPAPVMDSFRDMWHRLLPIGRDAASGGYRRFAWSEADAACRGWFAAQARSRRLTHEVDRNGNQWAWLGDPAQGGAVVTGSHLDSVPDGGAFDGPLGVVSAFAALDELHRRGVRRTRPLGVVAFADEEGARFGLSCVGSRLTAGTLTPEQARRLTDAEGITLAQAMSAAGHDPDAIGPDPERLNRIGALIELHIEQGRALDRSGDPVGVASAIWPHGRWRLDFRGEANHAGTTRLADRRDPMLPYAETVLAARRAAERAGAVATFGRIAVEPNGVNAIPSLVRAWLDARAPDHNRLDTVVAGVQETARARAAVHGVDLDVQCESFSPAVAFDHALRDTVVRILSRNADRSVPVLGTGAGHDAGILSGHVPAAMLFVRNPTGVSHSPAESATDDDCAAGVLALADVLEGLACS